jgi:chromosome segregation ATPase
VKFKESAVIAEGIKDEAAARSFEPGETAACDLQRAFALADEGKATIEEVRYRRRLQDAGTFMHGSRIFRGTGADAGKESIAADGVAGLLAVLRREVAALDASTKRLAESRTDVEAELKATADRQRRLAADKELWDRDAAAAERTAEAFAAEVTQTRQRLATAEQAIVAHGNELREAVGRLVERIDAVAPAPTQPAAATP